MVTVGPQWCGKLLAAGVTEDSYPLTEIKDHMKVWKSEDLADQVRTAVRFPMKLPLLIQTADGEVEAETEDISANGLAFTGKKLPKVASRIEFTIKMPAAIMGTAEDVMIQCTGRVVRHVKDGAISRAAAIIDEYLLRV